MKGRDFAELQAFAAVAEQGSFSGAAKKLQIAPSTLSQIIRELEERVGVLLIQRTTRRLSLTGAGLQLLGRLQPALSEISNAVEDAQQQSAMPRGTVRLHISRAAYGAFVEPALERLQRQYPDIHLDITVSDELVKTTASGFEIAIRLAEFADSSNFYVALGGPIRHVVVASRAYLKAHGTPNHPEDLARHNCIRWRRPGTEASYLWRFNLNQQWVSIPVAGSLTVSHCDVAVDAATQGLGIAFVLESWATAAIKAKQLISLLEQYLPPLPGWQICYPSRTALTSATLAVIEMLIGRVV
jgi:DNA-binding transcriptional LysR family regulator